MSDDSAQETSLFDAEENKLITIDLDELCSAIDSEVYSIKTESSSTDNTPKAAVKEEISMKSEPASSPAGKSTREARKRTTRQLDSPEVPKKQKLAIDSLEKQSKSQKEKEMMEDMEVATIPKLTDDFSEKQNGSETVKEMSEETNLDIWDEDPKGLYGLSPAFLKSKGIRTPLTNWVHLSNISCDKTVLREVMELAGNVLVCHVIRTKTGYAKVKYSHPVEAAQAVSMLNGQTLVGKKLTVSIDPGPHTEVFLPVGLKTLGPGFSDDGKPLIDVVRHLQRHLKGKQTPLSDSLFKAEIEEPTKEVEPKTELTEASVPEKTPDETKPKVIEPGPKTFKHKICQTDDNGIRNIIETVNEIKEQGVPLDDIIKALKALRSDPERKTKNKDSPSSVSKDIASEDKKEKSSPSRGKSSSRGNNESKRTLSRHGARSISPKRMSQVKPKFGPRTGSNNSFRPNAPVPNNSNNFNNPGRNFGPNNPGGNFGPGQNFNSGPNSGTFNPGFGPQASSGPFVQSNPGGNTGPFSGNSGPSGPFGGNSGPSGSFGGNSGPSGPFGGNSGPTGPFGGNSGPSASFGGNSGSFGGNSGQSGPFGGNSGPSGPSGPFGGSSGPSGPFGGNSGPSGGNSGPSIPPFGNNLGPIGPPRQNMGGSTGPNPQQRSSSNVVVLNNLPPSVTYQLLTEKMNQCGVVQFLNMTKPGTALVRYASDWEAARCINTFDKTVVDGHLIEVHYS